MGDYEGFEPKLDLGQVGDAAELLMPFLPSNRRIFYPLATTANFIIGMHMPQKVRCHNFKWMNAAVPSYYNLTLFIFPNTFFQINILENIHEHHHLDLV